MRRWRAPIHMSQRRLPQLFVILCAWRFPRPCLALLISYQTKRLHQLSSKTSKTLRFTSVEAIGKDEATSINREILQVSFFSFLHNAAMPFADLVDAAFLSTLDANSLGAVGVVRASQNSVSKLYNSPLSKTTISLIASSLGESKPQHDEDALPTAVASALAVALVLGSFQAFIFIVGARQILRASGIGESSSMLVPALAFMRARAWSAPTSTLWLVATNTFRGLGDASTPMVCSLLFNIFNIVGDYLLIEKFKIGIVGTALGTTIAQFVALVPLLVLLNRRVAFWRRISFKSFGRYLARYGTAGIFLVGRSMARVAVVSYISRQSATFGSVASSSYSVLYQIGMWVTIINDSVSIATQSMLSRHLTQKSRHGDQISHYVIRRSLQTGACLSSALSILLYTCRVPVVALLTKRADIQEAALHAFPVFLLAQSAKGIAFPITGVIMGGMDWSVAMCSMYFANVTCFIVLKFAEQSSRGLWMGWSAYYLTQALIGVLRYKSKTGVWKRLQTYSAGDTGD